MSRNDSLLNTGSTSLTFASRAERELKQKRADEKEKTLKDAQRMAPAFEVFKERIENRIANIEKIDYLKVEDALKDAESLRTTLLTNKGRLEDLRSLKNELELLIRKGSQDE